jgi:hypothetical protein
MLSLGQLLVLITTDRGGLVRLFSILNVKRIKLTLEKPDILFVKAQLIEGFSQLPLVSF